MLAPIGSFQAIARDTTAQQGALGDKLMNPATGPADSTKAQIGLELAKIQQEENKNLQEQSRNQFMEADARRRREIEGGSLFG